MGGGSATGPAPVPRERKPEGRASVKEHPGACPAPAAGPDCRALPPRPPSPLQRCLETLFAGSGGALTFERFMAEALYHPEFGYYSAHIRTIGGSRGDFATSPTLSALLGTAIAAWIRAEAAELGLTPPVSVIEVGGGEGSLLREVIRSLSLPRPAWWRRSPGAFRCHLVERSPRLRERQRETLRDHRRAVTWHEEIEAALEASGGEALLFSNELVDAFPVVALRRGEAGAGWSEIALAFDPAAGLREVLLPFPQSRADGFDPGAFAVLRDPGPWPPGQRVELHDAYRRWWGAWAPHLRRGSLLTIDYGASAPDLYRKRPSGTLRAYHRHQRHTGPDLYRFFGRQDLTADVCFDDLVAWGEALGFETVSLQSQAAFLKSRAPAEAASRARTDRAAAFLLEPGGAGEAFRVLHQRKPRDGDPAPAAKVTVPSRCHRPPASVSESVSKPASEPDPCAP